MARLPNLNPNLAAFLDMIAVSEIGEKLLSKSDDGYNVVVSGKLFEGYAKHPNIKVPLPNLGITSTAAGRYQLLNRYAIAYMQQLNLKDFSPESQDAIALQQIREQKATSDIIEGRFEAAVEKCSNIWASLPGAGYGQHENEMSKLKAAFVKAGGVVA